MNARNIPAIFWDCIIMRCAKVRSHMALNHIELDGEVPATVISGDTADISYLKEFFHLGLGMVHHTCCCPYNSALMSAMCFAMLY